MTDSKDLSTTTRVLALTHFCGATPRIFEAVLRRFETLDGIYAASAEDFLQIEGLGRKKANQLSRASKHLPAAAKMVQALTDRDISLVTRFDDVYGRLLFELNDPPSLLYVRGRLPDRNLKSVAVVGTRTASAEGLGTTSRLVKDLAAAGVQVVSSLVGGIDAAVHLAAAGAGGASFAVLDRGVDNVDPREGIPVAIDIIRSGGVLSEYAPEVPADDELALEANRVIIGLAQAVVVTEVYRDSGRTLDLLRACNDIGKLVFMMVDPEYGALADEASLAAASECGVIPMVGFDRVGDIVNVLV